MADLPVSRAEAKAKGSPRYRTGKRCKYGHLDERLTANSTCVTCYDRVLAAYRTNNKGRIRESDRIHRAANAQIHRDRDTAWRNANIDAVREADRLRYLNTDRDQLRKHRRDRKARQRNAPGSHTLAEIKAMLVAQKFRCAACPADIRSNKTRHLDHIQPLSKGGSQDLENLQWLCIPCNLNKAAKDPVAWAASRARLVCPAD